MANIDARLERLEKELKFRVWVHDQRLIEDMSNEELEHYQATGELLRRPPPGPGESRLDGMDRQALLDLWKSENQWLQGRNRGQMDFFGRHGHWPEQACRAGCNGTVRSVSESTDRSSAVARKWRKLL